MMKTVLRFGMGLLVLGLGLPTADAANDSRVPQLLVPGQKPKEKEPLRMSGLEIEVEVLGHMATTTLTMTFRNDLDRVLEGELVFPLGDGESVSRFAMSMGDIDTMREGVVIEKERGRQVFETIVRSKVDPGLLEMTKGNNFRSRVYPIPAKGEKRIVVGYEGTLRDEGGHYLYQLPLAFEKAIDDFKGRVRVLGGGEPDFSAGLLASAEVKVKAGAFDAGIARRDFQPGEPLSFKVPKSDEGATRTFAHTEIGRRERTTYFHTTVAVEREARDKAKPGRICLLWDGSGSAAARDSAKELAVLGTYFQRLGDVNVSLVVFRNTAGAKPEEFGVVAGDWSALRKRLAEIEADGGTRFGAIDLGSYDCDEFVLVSDGLNTFGAGEMGAGDKPVMALNSSAVADHGFLRSVARASGGLYVNLAPLGAAAAAESMAGQRLIFLGVEGGGDRLDDVYPRRGAPVEGGSFSLAGVLKGEPAELVLKFGFGDEVTQRVKVEVGPAGDADTRRAKRLWAAAKIAELGLDYEANEEAIIAVAKANSIVTRGTSLIVLDDIDDYVRFRVMPPKEMQAEYFERIEASDLVDEKPLREHMQEVVARFKARQKWYAKQFPGLEAVLVHSAQFEVARAKALVKKTGLKIFKKAKVAEESLQPAEKMLVEAKGLAAEAKKIGDDAAARAQWEAKAEAFNTRLMAFSADHDKRYPDMDRARISGEDDGGDPFGGEGDGGPRVAAFFGRSATGLAVPEEAMEGEEPAAPAADPFSAGVADGAHPLVPRRTANSASPGSGGGGAAGGRLRPNSIDNELLDAKAGEGRGDGRSEGGITLKKWNPDAPYLKEMKRAKGEDVYRVYLKARKKNLDSSAFFLEVADFFLEIDRRDLALRALSNIAEMDLESAPLLRILGHRLLQIGEAELAASVFEEVLAIRGEEPQSYRDLARALIATGADKRAAELLWEVVRRPWDGRFEAIDQIALAELNGLIARGGDALRPEGMESSLSELMPADLRIVLTWDADNTDIDLWVVDPAGEVCKYSHNRTVTGGRMSNDYTQGYGPEEFVIKNALPGEYIVKAHYYGNSQQTLAGATTIQAEITTDYGRSSEKAKAVTLRLRDEEDVVEVGRVSLGG